MKRLLLVFAGVMLVACSEQEPPPEPVRPVLSIKVLALDEENLGRFAGSIQARYETNVGFRVPGLIAGRNVQMLAPRSRRAPCSPRSIPRISKTSCARPRAIWPRFKRS